MAIQTSETLNRAVQHHRAGQLAAAAALYEEILRAEPRHANALHLLGLISRDTGNHDRAIDFFSRAIEADPNAAPFRLNRGISLRAVGRSSEALEDFHRARQIDSRLAEAYHQEGNLLKQLGRLPEAITALSAAVQIAPTLAPAWLNLGVACMEQDQSEQAIRAFRHAIALEPSRPEAQNILGVALLAAGEASAAETAFTDALRLNPNYAAAHDNLGRLKKSVGELNAAIQHFLAALAIRPDPHTHSNLLLALNYTSQFQPAQILAEHRRWNKLYAAPLAPVAPPLFASPPDGRRLRIGYVSPDFCHHAVAYFIAPVLAAHDRSKVEIFCYASVVKPDRVTERFRNLAAHWRDISSLDDEAAANLVRADKIDLLVDLAGHTAGNRLLLFARHPAPVQVTWLGYPNTTGLDSIHYRLTDEVSDPPGTTEGYYSEKLVRLPTTFSCYEPDPRSPAVSALPAKKNGAVTFGSFNNFAKITTEVIALWARLLRELPQANLLLKSRGLGDFSVVQRIKSDFASQGVAPERVMLNGEELSVAEHLDLYRYVDVALDPFPYNGTTTTCEALWMGVPVVTLVGHTHVSRVGASLLSHLNLGDWIASTPDDYVAVGLRAAVNLPLLEDLREKLRGQMRDCALCDATRFTRGLEEAFARMTGNSTV